jgi:hypothetical protein
VKRIGLSSRSEKRDHPVPCKRFVKRKLVAQLSQFSEQLCMAAKRQLSFDALDYRCAAFFLQGLAYPSDPVTIQGGERWTAPERICLAE